MALINGNNILKLQVLSEDSKELKAELIYYNIDFKAIIDIEEALVTALVALGKKSIG